jgi:hypothetical protein
MNFKLFVTAAVSIVMVAGAASAKDHQSDNVTLPDGSIVATVNAGKTNLVRDSATSITTFLCNPVCVQITPIVYFSPGIVSNVAKTLSNGLGWWPALKALRPAVDNSYVSSYSQGGNAAAGVDQSSRVLDQSHPTYNTNSSGSTYNNTTTVLDGGGKG